MWEPTRSLVTLLAERAPCGGLDPLWFEATDYRYAEPALEVCAACPVVALCDAVVRPRDSYFDGVAAGKVWVNGVEVGTRRGHREPTIRTSCGSEYGYELHRVNGERQCPRCRQAKSARRAERRRSKEWMTPSSGLA